MPGTGNFKIIAKQFASSCIDKREWNGRCFACIELQRENYSSVHGQYFKIVGNYRRKQQSSMHAYIKATVSFQLDG